MLVLSRRPGEDIVIGGNIVVRVLAVDGGKLRLGVSAPPEVPVDRAEVHARRQEFQEPAAPPDLDRLEGLVRRGLRGRVRDLRLSRRADGLVLHGRAATYHAKQLAQLELQAVAHEPIAANEIAVC